MHADKLIQLGHIIYISILVQRAKVYHIFTVAQTAFLSRYEQK